MKTKLLLILAVLTVTACVMAVYAADYRETATTGQVTTWRRAANIEIRNPYNDIPSLTFYEEDKIRLPDGTVIAGLGVRDPRIQVSMSDPLTEFPLLSPETGEVVGTARYQDIYVMLYSLYLDLAAKRDAALAVPPPSAEFVTNDGVSAPVWGTN